MTARHDNIPQLSSVFMGAMKRREKILPKEALRKYVSSFLDKREIFLESVSRFGAPQYFFDKQSLARKVKQFHAAFSKCFNRYRIFYALKSNSFRGLCRHVVSEGLGLDVSSGFELSVALDTNCMDIIFSGPGKTDEDIMLAIQNRKRVTLLLDSFGELQRLEKLLKREKEVRDSLKLGIRLRSESQGIWNKFGIPLKELSTILEKTVSLQGADLCGLQFHTSWNLDPSAQVAMLNKIGSFLKNSPKSLWRTLQFIDIGGGFWPEQGEWFNPQNTLKGRLIELLDPGHRFTSTHYFQESKPLEHFAGEIAGALSLIGRPLRDLVLWMEPGRWLSTPAMHILIKVVDKKDPRTIITGGGTNILGWERPLSEYIPVINLTRPGLNEHKINVFGSLCTPLDIWGRSVFCDGIETEDILLIPDQGAYTYSLRQSFIKPRSKVVSYDGNSLKETEKEEKY